MTGANMRYTQRMVKVGQCLIVDYFGHPEEIDAEIELDVEGTRGAKRQLHFHRMDPDYDGPDISVDVPSTIKITLDSDTKLYLKDRHPEIAPPDFLTVIISDELRRELEKQGEYAFSEAMADDYGRAMDAKVDERLERMREGY